MRDFNIFILTVKRPGGTNYLKRCVESIRQDYDGLIYLMVGGKDHSYIDEIDRAGLIVCPINEKGLKNNIQKAAKGYYNCLTFDRKTPCLVLEDDGVLEKGWYNKMKTLLTFTAEERFILSLITPGEGSVPVPDSRVPSIQLFNYRAFLDYKVAGQVPEATIVTYCNTTGVYYTASMLQTRLPEFILKFGAEGDAVHDIILGQYMFRYNLPIYIAVPNLLRFEVDSADSSLGSVKHMSHIDYSKWDFSKL